MRRKYSFVCPNGTVFDQKTFVCNWWYNVDCNSSPNFYGLNSLIGVGVPAATNGRLLPVAVSTQPLVAETNRPSSYGSGYSTT